MNSTMKCRVHLNLQEEIIKSLWIALGYPYKELISDVTLFPMKHQVIIYNHQQEDLTHQAVEQVLLEVERGEGVTLDRTMGRLLQSKLSIINLAVSSI